MRRKAPERALPEIPCGHLSWEPKCAECKKAVEFIFQHYGYDTWFDKYKTQMIWNDVTYYKAGRGLRSKKVFGSPEYKLIKKWSDEWHTKAAVVCCWCGGTFSPSQCHIDHVIPLSRGGLHLMANVAISCASCNFRKNDKLPEEFCVEKIHRN
jgi:hypothetical protein